MFRRVLGHDLTGLHVTVYLFIKIQVVTQNNTQFLRGNPELSETSLVRYRQQHYIFLLFYF